MEENLISDEIVTFAQLLAEQPVLREWFLDLSRLPHAARAASFKDMAAQMHSGGENEATISMIASLAEPGIYDAVSHFLSESC